MKSLISYHAVAPGPLRLAAGLRASTVTFTFCSGALKRLLLVCLASVLLTGISTSLLASVFVDARSNIFESGRGAGGTPVGITGALYPILGVSFAPGTGQTISFNGITGTTTCGTGPPCNPPPYGPDGSSLVFPSGSGATDGTNISTPNTGISGIVFTGREMGLIGVFLDNNAPSGNGPFAPTFVGAGGTYNADTDTTFPAFFLGQAFWIGDGKTGFGNGAGTRQVWQAPAGATRLFLGFADSFNNFSGAPSAYGDNIGGLTVDINTTGLGGANSSAIPEPGTIMLMGLGLVGLGFLRKRLAT